MEELARRTALSVDNALLYREAQEAVRLRDEFLSVASHELKTPLTPLSLKLDSLARELGSEAPTPGSERRRKDVEVLQRQVRRLSDLVTDLLDVSRIGARRLILCLDQVELTALAREVALRFEPEAVRVGSRINIQGDESITGTWDRLRLEQVITNLLSNALKYGAGTPIELKVWDEDGRAKLSVKDEGIGIAPEALTKIFGRFERGVSQRHYGGLGLGLFITREIVEAHGGTVEVESQAEHGAVFTVSLPMR
jgi:signal transduction histidine kinase